MQAFLMALGCPVEPLVARESPAEVDPGWVTSTWYGFDALPWVHYHSISAIHGQQEERL